MLEAARLGEAARGRSAPNPNVGCVIVKDGVIVGRGATGNGGRPHAEAAALAEAGRQAKGATLYTTRVIPVWGMIAAQVGPRSLAWAHGSSVV